MVTQSPTVIILSPQSNETFRTSNVVLKVNVGSQYWVINGVYYEADWQEGVHRIFNPSTASISMRNKVSIRVNFTEIPDGRHDITVYANTHDGSHVSASIFFTTDASPPRIMVLSIENKTYFVPELILNFTVDEPISWAGYSLDGQENVSVSGNMTLNRLLYGSHSLVVYANDTVGNMGKAGRIDFIIAKPELFPTTLVAAASGVIVAVIIVGLLAYSKKRKR